MFDSIKLESAIDYRPPSIIGRVRAIMLAVKTDHRKQIMWAKYPRNLTPAPFVSDDMHARY